MTPAGKRDQRVTFQRRALDDNQDRLGAWEDGFGRWARVVPRTRGEVALESRLQGVQPVEVTVLLDSATRDVDATWRLMWRGVAYNINAVAATQDRTEVVILAQGDQTDG